ncbi:hypothetical protein D6853_01920 [Butyrivibrio sp. X503]|uniref:DUF6465 family protein n=1 Tax=Butyrivibrio sp. X503 TaxID=2364878 RepID=UPI000EA8E7F4|nr:DUF6465 family protein [Butyrivibrio sp. X503]RKM58312.1 hypothetical protein D6853_01920 [Butyrivibrio sp. X503]
MAAAKIKTELQYGSLSIGEDKIVSKAKKAYGKRDIKELNIYVKPEEGKAYYVVNNDPSNSGSFDLYD